MFARVILALLIACAAATGRACASDDDDAVANVPSIQKAYATLSVDGVSFGDIVVLVDGTDVWLAATDATRAHVSWGNGTTRDISHAVYVSLASLAPATTFAFDDKNFSLAITVRAASLGTKTYGSSDALARPHDAARPTSGFLNYNVSTQSAGGASGYFESALTSHDSMLYSSEAVSTGGPAQRGQTYFAHDDVAHLRREIAGDVAGSGGDALLGQIDVLGFGVQRQFAIDPYLYRFPQPSVSGLLAEPGTATVYINGLLERSIPLSPGGFDLTNIPVTTGTNDVQVVIRDADGNVRTYNQSYLGSEALLRKGLTDYSYGAGFLRTSNQSYDNPAVTASYRVGTSDAFTAGAQGVATAHRSELEANFDVRAGSTIVQGGEAVSNAYNVAGSASTLGVAYAGRNNGVSVSSTLRGQTYTDFDSAPIPVQAAHFEINANASQRLARNSSLSASYYRQVFPTLAPESTFVATLSEATRSGQLSASFAQSRSGSNAETSALGVSLTTQIGRHGSFTAGQTLGDEAQSSFEYTFAPPSNDIGFGYALHHTSGPTGNTLAMLQDHTAIGDVQAYAGVSASGATNETLAVSGAAVFVDGHLMPARAVTGGFALVETGGVGNVPVMVDGRPVGNTNGHGLLVVSSIGAYAQNRVQLDDAAAPMGVEIRHGTEIVSPGNRGGSVASFAVKHVSYFVGTVLLGLRGTIPVDGTLELVRGTTRVRTMLDDTGAYYFENLVPGRYRATVRFGAKPCAFDFDVPPATGVANDLGERTCAR